MGAAEDHVLMPQCMQRHVLNCQFNSWYPLFRHCTPRSIVLEVDEDVVRYLEEDGVILPRGFNMSCGDGQTDDSDDEVEWDVDDDDEDDERPEFVELLEGMREAINNLGGAVFPKLNWSCPKDAAWVNGGSLKCLLPGDVLCLLKSSTFITHDLQHAFDACVDATLKRPDRVTIVLRKWCNLHPSMLFRCFIRDRRITGACQRDCGNFFEFLAADGPRIKGLLHEFLTAEVCNKFPDPDCVADVYIDRQSRVWLLDINPFSPVTDSLLFQWGVGNLSATPSHPLNTPLSNTRIGTTTGHQGDVMDESGARVHGEEGALLETNPPQMSEPRARAEEAEKSCRPVVQIEGVEVGAAYDGDARHEEDSTPQGGKSAGEGIGFVLAESRGIDDFNLRLVPSDTHVLSNPMGCYRGPVDVGMGLLGEGVLGGGIDFEQLVRQQQTC